MNTVPNQLVITVQKEKTDKQHLYSCINLEALDLAAMQLKSVGAFKLWMYIAKNQNQYEFALSRADFMRWSGVSAGTYQTAVQALKEMHFLMPSPTQKNKWIFYEKPLNVQKPNLAEGDFIIEVPAVKQEEITKTRQEWSF